MTQPEAAEVWPGRWVEDRLGVRLRTAADSWPLPDLVGLALRRNPRRAHLLVSPVLGKHVPAPPSIVAGAGQMLGRAVAGLIGDDVRPLVLGYAETATALGALVADELGGDYLHSTRRPVSGFATVLTFEETHSHATSHLVLPADPALLRQPRAVVLVDDEISTGSTALATVRALHALAPHPRYVIAALVDVRDATDAARVDALATELGTVIDVVALGRGTIELPDDLAQRSADALAMAAAPDEHAGTPATLDRVDVLWPPDVPAGARHGVDPATSAALAESAAGLAAPVAAGLGGHGPVLVLGFEELMYVPLLLALALETTLAVPVRFSTTTRSPVLAVDEPGYAIRTRLVFPAHDDPVDGPGERYAYNVAPAAGTEPFADIVLVIDDAADTPALHATDGLLARLAAVTPSVHLVVLPARPPVG